MLKKRHKLIDIYTLLPPLSGVARACEGLADALLVHHDGVVRGGHRLLHEVDHVLGGAALGALLFLLLQKLAPDFTERARGKANATRREEDSAP